MEFVSVVCVIIYLRRFLISLESGETIEVLTTTDAVPVTAHGEDEEEEELEQNDGYVIQVKKTSGDIRIPCYVVHIILKLGFRMFCKKKWTNEQLCQFLFRCRQISDSRFSRACSTITSQPARRTVTCLSSAATGSPTPTSSYFRRRHLLSGCLFCHSFFLLIEFNQHIFTWSLIPHDFIMHYHNQLSEICWRSRMTVDRTSASLFRTSQNQISQRFMLHFLPLKKTSHWTRTSSSGLRKSLELILWVQVNSVLIGYLVKA